MVMDTHQTYCGDHHETYTNAKSLWCTSKPIQCYMSVISQLKIENIGVTE